MGTSFSSSNFEVGTTRELPDYTEWRFRRDIAECTRHMAIVRLERATDEGAHEHSSTCRALEDIVRWIPPSFRKNPEYLAVADGMSRELGIAVPDPVLYTIVRN